MKQEFQITRRNNPKAKPDPNTLEFGKLFTDHMFMMDYEEGKGWFDGRVVPYAPIQIDPAAAVLHYSQTMFEGLKAYKTEDGRVILFRPDKNIDRMNMSNDRICMPLLDKETVLDAIKTIVDVDSDWIPSLPGTSLYVRPFLFATEPFLGVRPAQKYTFMIILSPVGPYYKGGLTPTKIFVEDEYTRAVEGGTGSAKIGGNYAMSLKSQVKAKDKGFEQVLWLDGIEKKYAEEIGTSNAFFIIDGVAITPPTKGTILPGITRDSILTLLKDFGIPVEERRIALQEIYDAHAAGKLDEMFATGTAAVISPVGTLSWKGNDIVINNNEIGKVSQKLYDTLYGIQTGKTADKFGWTVEVK